MLVIELEFPAGRYHATPWGRNVNEGDVEWPPSPYRLARALVDIWKRRKPEWNDVRMNRLLKAFSGSPNYLLPPATSAHVRSYLSSNDTDPSKKQLVFDAFVVVDRTEKLLMGFEHDLSGDSLEELEELLGEMNYLGRSESWVKARVRTDTQGTEWNCYPASELGAVGGQELVRLACVTSPGGYDELPRRPERLEWKGKKEVKTGKACSWLEALCLSSKRLLDEGWSSPPALSWVDYVREADALSARPYSEPTLGKSDIRCVKYQLVSTVLPRITETASFAERIRRHLMGIHKRIQQDDASLVSQKFSGKDPGGRPLRGHQHAFYFPLDEDRDGRLDHLLVHAAEPFKPSELRALDRLNSIWQPNGRPDVKLVMVSLASRIPGEQSTRWVTVTPFVTARHYRKGRGSFVEWLVGEVRTECKYHGLPTPSRIEWIRGTVGNRQTIRWMEFIRSRKGETPARGYGCVLTFDEPVHGPFALGSGCHYGLGLFAPLKE